MNNDEKILRKDNNRYMSTYRRKKKKEIEAMKNEIAFLRDEVKRLTAKNKVLNKMLKNR